MNRVKKSSLIKVGLVFGTIFWVNMGWLFYTNYQKENFEKTIDTQQKIVYNKNIEIKELTDDIGVKREEIDNLKDEIEKRKSEVSRGSSRYRTITTNITHYTHTGNPTASGRMPVAGRTVACNYLPLGSKVKINNHIYIVEDRVGLDGNIIDVFVDSESEAIQKGRYTAEVAVVGMNRL